MSTPEPDLLTPDQLRDALGISSATYYRWLREGRLVGVRVGRRWRFPRALVSQLLSGDPAPEQRLDALHSTALAIDRLLEERGARAEERPSMSPVQPLELARSVLHGALLRGASDVQLAPMASGLRLRERVDGRLLAQPPLPLSAAPALTEAFFELAGAAEPSAGRAHQARFFHPFRDRQIDVRLASYPTGLGTALSLRLLDPERLVVSLDEIGLEEADRSQLRGWLRRGAGVILVNGPSGSGKSTTLYALLAELAGAGELSILTAEDPVEVYVDGLLQASVSEQMGFPEAIRAMLRADLDVGMVSEIRDRETADVLFAAGATGHLMLSALHAAEGLAALERLVDEAQLTPLRLRGLVGVLSQRLVPRVGADGQPRGRVLVSELLEPSEALLGALQNGARGEALRAHLPAGFQSLRTRLDALVQAGTVRPADAAVALGLSAPG